jgi:hypothetical protein
MPRLLSLQGCIQRANPERFADSQYAAIKR